MSSLYDSSAMALPDKTPSPSRVRTWLRAGILTLALAGAGTGSTLLIGRAYERYKADQILRETQEVRDGLAKAIDAARQSVTNNAFLMGSDSESASLREEIAHSEERLAVVDNDIARARTERERGNYGDVRTMLDPLYGLKQDEMMRETPGLTADKERQGLYKRVIGHCDDKRQARDAVISNEWFLMARLKHPRVDGGEKDAKLAALPDKFFDMIPVKTSQLDAALTQVPEELRNSMGANLVKRKPRLEHILAACDKDVNVRAQQLYDEALSSYKGVKQKNDALVWYRAEKHDGKLTTDDYRVLIARQEEPIKLIHAGDNALDAFDAYDAELHDQHYTFVKRHDRQRTTFRHTHLVPRPHVSLDADGNVHTTVSLESEAYTTEGNKFYCVLETVTPSGSTERSNYVGEIDGVGNWIYPPGEQPGWVVQWKLLHQPRSRSKSGQMSELNPQLAPFMPDCKR